MKPYDIRVLLSLSYAFIFVGYLITGYFTLNKFVCMMSMSSLFMAEYNYALFRTFCHSYDFISKWSLDVGVIGRFLVYYTSEKNQFHH